MGRTLLSTANIDPMGFRCWQGNPLAMPRPHRHSDVELNFVETGNMYYLHGGNHVLLKAGHLGILWAAVPHQLMRIDAPVICHWVTLPLAWFLQWQLNEALTQGVLNGELLIDPVPLPEQDLPLFKRWAKDMTTDSAERKKIVLLEVEARTRRMALSVDYKPPRKGAKRKSGHGGAAAGVTKVEQMANFVADHYTEELSVSDIADAVGLHPNYAMTLFRRTFGVSLVDYVTQHRISHSQRLLATTDAKVLDIALDSGFGSLSRFYAAFSESCHQAPAAYRAAMRAPR